MLLWRTRICRQLRTLSPLVSRSSRDVTLAFAHSCTIFSLQLTLEQTTPVTCHAECDQAFGCSGPHAFECARCLHFRRMPDHVCVDACPSDSYVNPATRTCHKCTVPCRQCKGGDVSKDCLSCMPGWLMLEGEGVCVGSCPPGSFLYEGKTYSPVI